VGSVLRSKPGSVSAAIAEYYGSQAFRSLTGETPQKRRAILERFREQYGDRPLASLPKEFVVALFDTMAPHAAINWLAAFRHFFRWCEQRKLLRTDPTLGIRLKMPKSDGHHTWTEDEIAQFEAHHPVGSKPRLALGLAIYTGQRRGDVIRLGRQHIRDGVLTLRPGKDQEYHWRHFGDSGAPGIAGDHRCDADRSSHTADNQEQKELQPQRLYRSIPRLV
jgi:integrase